MFQYIPTPEERNSESFPKNGFVYRNSELDVNNYSKVIENINIKPNSSGIALLKDMETNICRLKTLMSEDDFDPNKDRLLARFTINADTGKLIVETGKNAPVNAATALFAFQKQSQEAFSYSPNLFRVVHGRESYHLKEGDVIKLANTWLRVHQIILGNSDREKFRISPEGSLGMIASPCVEDCQGADDPQCHVCLSGPIDEESNDLLSRACNCYIHKSCLQRWKLSRLSTLSSQQRQADFGVHDTTKLRCEICLAQYSLYMSKEDPESRRQVEDEMAQARARNEFVDENSYRERIKKSYYACMHNNEDPQILGAPAIVFEVVSSLKNGSKGPRFLPVTFGGHREGVAIINKEALESGRLRSDYANQIEITGDSALSDHHATIQWHQDKFILTDFNSRYGTLVKLDNHWETVLAMSNSAAAQAARDELKKDGIPAEMKFSTSANVLKAQNEQKKITLQLDIEGVLIDVERF